VLTEAQLQALRTKVGAELGLLVGAEGGELEGVKKGQ